MQAGQGLDKRGVGQERQQTAEVARRIEHERVRRGRPVRAQARIPGLDQRRGGRESRERRADREGEDADQPKRRRRRAWIAQCVGDLERQEQRRDDQNGAMHERLPWDRPDALQQMSIAIADQEGSLEEGEAGVPHRRRAAEQGKDQFRDHRLDQEDQRRAREHGAREDRPGESPGDGRRRKHGPRHLQRRLSRKSAASARQFSKDRLGLVGLAG